MEKEPAKAAKPIVQPKPRAGASLLPPGTTQLASYHRPTAQASGAASLAPPAQQYPEPIQRKPNATGLPDQLKSGIENLSGHSLDDVKVHYNSAKPAQLNAHAYAQGTNIHLASGQERHLPHEAWHVVQQKQGRVQPTMQMNGSAINDNAGLEKEADVMGGRALQRKAQSAARGTNPRRQSLSFANIVQAKVIQLGIAKKGRRKKKNRFTHRKAKPYPSTLKWKNVSQDRLLHLAIKRAFWRKNQQESDIPSQQKIITIAKAINSGYNPRLGSFRTIIIRGSKDQTVRLPGKAKKFITVPSLRLKDHQFSGVGRMGREAPKNRYFPGTTKFVSDGAIPKTGDARRSVVISKSDFNKLAKNNRFTTKVFGPFNLHQGNMPSGDRPPNDLNKILGNTHSAKASGIKNAENLHMRAWSLGGQDHKNNLLAGSHNLNSAMITAEGTAKDLGLQSTLHKPTTYKVTALVEKINNQNAKKMNWVYAVAIQIKGAGKSGTFYFQQQLDQDDASYIKKEHWDEVENEKAKLF